MRIRREPGVNGPEEAHGQPIRRNGVGAEFLILGITIVNANAGSGWREANALVIDRDRSGEMGASWAAIDLDVGMVDLSEQGNVAVWAGFGHELVFRDDGLFNRRNGVL
jgi:hypothetical protein